LLQPNIIFPNDLCQALLHVVRIYLHIPVSNTISISQDVRVI